MIINYKRFSFKIPEKTHLRLKENAKAFELKRTCVLGKTHLRFNQNALAFQSKRTCVLEQTHLRFLAS